MFYLISAYRKEYTIEQNQERHRMLLNALQQEAEINDTLAPIPCIGCYKGDLEQSIQTWADEASLLGMANEFEQESILRVDDGQATLIYLADGREESIGQWRPASEEEAKARESYTFDVRYGTFYVVDNNEPKETTMQQVTRTIVDNVPVGLYLVTFESIWGSPCNVGEHDDCAEHGCVDNEPSYIAAIESSVTEVTADNYLTLDADVTDQTVELNNDVDPVNDTHDLRPRLFASKKDAERHVTYTVNRFNNPEPWEVFVRGA